jgi:hypothetical protein
MVKYEELVHIKYASVSCPPQMNSLRHNLKKKLFFTRLMRQVRVRGWMVLFCD